MPRIAATAATNAGFAGLPAASAERPWSELHRREPDCACRTLDERRENHDNDYRGCFRQIEHAIILVVAENILCVVGCNRAVDGLVKPQGTGMRTGS